MGPLSKFRNHSVSFNEIVIEKIHKKNFNTDSCLFCCDVILLDKGEKTLYLDKNQLKEFSRNKTLTLNRNEYKLAKLFKNCMDGKTSSNDLDDELMFKFDSEDEKEFKTLPPTPRLK
jgi:hypothetical protein